MKTDNKDLLIVAVLIAIEEFSNKIARAHALFGDGLEPSSKPKKKNKKRGRPKGSKNKVQAV